MTKENEKLFENSLRKLDEWAKTKDDKFIQEAYDTLKKAFDMWTTTPEFAEEIKKMLPDDCLGNDLRVYIDFGQKEDFTTYIVLYAKYNNEKDVVWRVFPYDDFPELIEDALDSPSGQLSDNISVQDSIKLVLEDKWLEKIQVVKNRFTGTQKPMCFYRENL